MVHKKTSAVLALVSVKAEDKREMEKVVESANHMFKDAARISWGGGIMGPKSQAKTRLREKELAREAAQRMAV